MRPLHLFFLSLVLVGSSFAQDTNFPVGPQYLITTGSPMLLHPIATPSLSLGEAQAAAANVGTTEATSELASPSLLSTGTYLGSVYWGEHKDTELVARRLETPSAAPADTAWYMNAVASQFAPAPPTVSGEVAEVSSGPSVIQLTGTAIPSNLPPSILDVGVTGLTDARSLVARGYGVSLGDVAAYWKSHRRTAPRVFTNADVVRPRS